MIFTLWYYLPYDASFLFESYEENHSLSGTLQNLKVGTTFSPHPHNFLLRGFQHFFNDLFYNTVYKLFYAFHILRKYNGENAGRTSYRFSHTVLVPPPSMAILAFVLFCLGLLSMNAEFCESDMKKSKPFKLPISCFLCLFVYIWNWMRLSCWSVWRNSDMACPWTCLPS